MRQTQVLAEVIIIFSRFFLIFVLLKGISKILITYPWTSPQAKLFSGKGPRTDLSQFSIGLRGLFGIREDECEGEFKMVRNCFPYFRHFVLTSFFWPVSFSWYCTLVFLKCFSPILPKENFSSGSLTSLKPLSILSKVNSILKTDYKRQFLSVANYMNRLSTKPV